MKRGLWRFAEQRQQLQRCVQEGSDAILLGAVSYQGLREAIKVTPLPVFGLVNDLPSGLVQAKVGVSWYQMGWQIGHWLAQRHPAGSKPVSVALFPARKRAAATTSSSRALPMPSRGAPSSWSPPSAATTAGKSSVPWCRRCWPAIPTSTIWWGRHRRRSGGQRAGTAPSRQAPGAEHLLQPRRTAGLAPGQNPGRQQRSDAAAGAPCSGSGGLPAATP